MKKFQASIEHYLEALNIKDYNFQNGENYLFYGFGAKNPAISNLDCGIGIYYEKPEFLKFTISLRKVKPTLKNYQLISKFNTEYPWYVVTISDGILILTHSCYLVKNNDGFIDLLDFILNKIYGSDNAVIKNFVNSLE